MSQVPSSWLNVSVPLFSKTAPSVSAMMPPFRANVPSLTSFRPASLAQPPPVVTEPLALGPRTVAPEPDIVLSFVQAKVLETLIVPGPVRTALYCDVRFLIEDDSVVLSSSRVLSLTFREPSPWTTAAWLVPAVTLTVLPSPMQATSVELGAWPALQFPAVCQVPSAAPVQLLVHSAACAVVAPIAATNQTSNPAKTGNAFVPRTIRSSPRLTSVAAFYSERFVLSNILGRMVGDPGEPILGASTAPLQLLTLQLRVIVTPRVRPSSKPKLARAKSKTPTEMFRGAGQPAESRERCLPR